jgi:hypothetical protein
MDPEDPFQRDKYQQMSHTSSRKNSLTKGKRSG